MKQHQGFTIIELLIALFLSSFIMIGMIQSYRNAVSSLGVCRESMAINRKVCLLLNELERDFTSMFVPYPTKEIIPESEKDDPKVKEKQQKEEAQKKEEEDKKKNEQKKSAGEGLVKDKDNEIKETKKKFEPLKNAIMSHVYEDESRRIHGKKFDLFKNINFITTHPLQVYGDKRVRLVRVMYELVKDKKKSKPGAMCYHLYRKETPDIENFKMKEDEEAVALGRSKIRTHLVADNIKEMFIELITIKPPDEEEQSSNKKNEEKKEEEIRLFVWGEKDFTVGSVPKALDVRMIFWDDAIKRTHEFQFYVPVFSYPTEEPEDNEEKQVLSEKNNEDKQKHEEVSEDNQKGMVVTNVQKTSSTTFQSVGATK